MYEDLNVPKVGSEIQSSPLPNMFLDLIDLDGFRWSIMDEFWTCLAGSWEIWERERMRAPRLRSCGTWIARRGHGMKIETIPTLASTTEALRDGIKMVRRRLDQFSGSMLNGSVGELNGFD